MTVPRVIPATVSNLIAIQVPQLMRVAILSG